MLKKKILKLLKIKHETKIVSAHRTPDRMYKFAKNAKKIIIDISKTELNRNKLSKVILKLC